MTCRVRVTLPADAWMASLTRAHPSVSVEILDRLEISARAVLFDVQLPSVHRIDWSEEIRRLPEVRYAERIDANPRYEIYRVLFTGRTFVPLAKRLGVLRRFPFPVQNGIATWHVVGPDSRVRALLQALRRSRIEYRIESVHRGLRSGPRPVLTGRQQEILRRAIAEGYFEVPRRISLTGLAARIGVAASTLSVTLAVIERKLVEPLAR